LKYLFILLGQDVISKHFVKYPEFWQFQKALSTQWCGNRRQSYLTKKKC